MESSSMALDLDQLAAVEVGSGCLRRELPAPAGVRAWVVDMAPGSEWPWVDHHPGGEAYFVVSGEVIEDGLRHVAGTYVRFMPGSSHRPRSEHGVRLIGFNPGASTFE